MTLTDQHGTPIDSETKAKAPCPKCGKGPDRRKKYDTFGGWWKLICLCGETIDSGRDE